MHTFIRICQVVISTFQTSQVVDSMLLLLLSQCCQKCSQARAKAQSASLSALKEVKHNGFNQVHAYTLKAQGAQNCEAQKSGTLLKFNKFNNINYVWSVYGLTNIIQNNSKTLKPK